MFQKITQIMNENLFFLMIPNGERWHYPSVKKLSVLVIRLTKKHKSDFYCLNCLHSFRTKNKLNI